MEEGELAILGTGDIMTAVTFLEWLYGLWALATPPLTLQAPVSEAWGGKHGGRALRRTFWVRGHRSVAELLCRICLCLLH